MDGDRSPTGFRLDASSLRVLAHPLRSRLLSALRTGGPATATDLASRLGTNTGATSYHLRKLESVGLVVDTEEGEGRRRLWRASTDSHEWRVGDFVGDEDSETAINWLVRDYTRQLGEHVEHWLDVEGSWPTPWRNALGLSDTAVLVTPEQLQQMQQEIGDVLARYRHRGDGDPRARTVAAYTVYFPRDLEPVPDETEPG